MPFKTEHFYYIDFQGFGDDKHLAKACIDDTPLYAADLTEFQVGAECQVFLRQATRLAHGAQVFAEAF
jgi:hypothetical protein